MPQLEFVTFASQIFWLAVTFGILYLVMSRSALPTVREVLHNRQTRIVEDLKKAEKLKKEAESAEADFTSVIAAARQKAGKLLSDVRTKAEKEAAARHARLDETFVRQTNEADHRITVMKKDALEKLIPVAVDVAHDMAEKIAGISLDRKKVEQVAAEISKAA